MKEVKKFLDEEREGSYSFVFLDLDGEYVYKYNENKQMTSAGCMKLIVAVAVLKEVENGSLAMDEFIAIKEADKKPGSGILREFIERNYTLKELITVMLVDGDNTATYKLMQLLGIEKINNIFKEMGLSNTVLTENPGVVDNLTTANDLSLVLKHLYKNSYLNKTNSQFIVELLRQRVKSKIAYYLDYKVRTMFASKTGDGEGIENEVALINTPNGNFAFVILSCDLPNSVYGMVSLARAGMMVWNTINDSWSVK